MIKLETDTSDIRKTRKIQQIYLIYKMQVFNMENNASAAMQYELIGFVTEQRKANRVVERGGIITPDKCWVLNEPTPRYKYECVKPFIFTGKNP